MNGVSNEECSAALFGAPLHNVLRLLSQIILCVLPRLAFVFVKPDIEHEYRGILHDFESKRRFWNWRVVVEKREAHWMLGKS